MNATNDHSNDNAALRAVEELMTKLQPPQDRRRRLHDKYLRIRHINPATIDQHWNTLTDNSDHDDDTPRNPD